MFTTKPQPETQWPSDLPRVECGPLCASITPRQCEINQQCAHKIMSRLAVTGTIANAGSSGSMRREGFNRLEIYRFAACSQCYRCDVAPAWLELAIQSCREAIIRACERDPDYYSDEAKEQRRKERRQREYARQKEKNESTKRVRGVLRPENGQALDCRVGIGGGATA